MANGGGKQRFVNEPHSSYYLHPSEGPGMLITAVVFDGKNYDLWKKGWKVCDLETREIFVSWDIVFCETTYPFRTKPKSLGSDDASGNLLGLHHALDDGPMFYQADGPIPVRLVMGGIHKTTTHVTQPTVIW